MPDGPDLRERQQFVFFEMFKISHLYICLLKPPFLCDTENGQNLQNQGVENKISKQALAK